VKYSNIALDLPEIFFAKKTFNLRKGESIGSVIFKNVVFTAILRNLIWACPRMVGSLFLLERAA